MVCSCFRTDTEQPRNDIKDGLLEKPDLDAVEIDEETQICEERDRRSHTRPKKVTVTRRTKKSVAPWMKGSGGAGNSYSSTDPNGAASYSTHAQPLAISSSYPAYLHSDTKAASRTARYNNRRVRQNTSQRRAAWGTCEQFECKFSRATIGLTFDQNDVGMMVVVGVRVGGDADIEGVLAGDLLLAINGKMCANMDGKLEVTKMLVNAPRPLAITFMRLPAHSSSSSDRSNRSDFTSSSTNSEDSSALTTTTASSISGHTPHGAPDYLPSAAAGTAIRSNAATLTCAKCSHTMPVARARFCTNCGIAIEKVVHQHTAEKQCLAAVTAMVAAAADSDSSSSDEDDV